MKLFHDTGKVLLVKQHTSQPSKLNQGNIDVSSDHYTCILDWNFFIVKYIEACIACSLDAYLDELWTQLEEACGVKVHDSTVWSALKRRGFTLKKVSIWIFMLVSQVQSDYDPDYKSCYGVKWFEVISIHVPNWPQLSAWSICLCWWKLIWLMCNIPMIGMKLCYMGTQNFHFIQSCTDYSWCCKDHWCRLHSWLKLEMQCTR